MTSPLAVAARTVLERNPAALALARAAAHTAANPPASQELSEQPAGHAAPPTPQRTTRTRRPAATSAVAEAL